MTLCTDGLDIKQLIGGELSSEDWLAESVHTGILKKLDDEES